MSVATTEVAEIWYQEHIQNNSYATRVVVSDVRFDNEIEAIRDRGGIIIKLVRETGLEPDMHESERNIVNNQNYDYLIDNNGNLHDLHHEIDVIMAKQWKLLPTHKINFDTILNVMYCGYLTIGSVLMMTILSKCYFNMISV